MKRYLLLIICIINLLAGCTTYKVAYIPTETEQISLEPLQVKIDYDIYLLRIDLHRETKSIPLGPKKIPLIPQGGPLFQMHDTKQVHMTVDADYHYLGVYLGNGLFLDANKNLSINLVKLLGLDKENYFKIVKKVHGSSIPYIIYEKNGNIFQEKNEKGIIKEITLKDNSATLKVGGLKKEQDIIISGDDIIYDPHGTFDALSKIKIIKTPDGARIPKFWDNEEIILNPDGSVSLGKTLLIKPQGKSLIFEISSRHGSYKNEYFLKRSKDSLVYYDKKLNGITIDITKEVITVKKDQQIEVYEIYYQSP